MFSHLYTQTPQKWGFAPCFKGHHQWVNQLNALFHQDKKQTRLSSLSHTVLGKGAFASSLGSQGKEWVFPPFQFGLPVPLRNCMYKCFWHRLTWCCGWRFLKLVFRMGSLQTVQLCKCLFPNSLFVANITVFPSATVSGLPCLSPICNLMFLRLH
jgi:hypothetical protein